MQNEDRNRMMESNRPIRHGRSQFLRSFRRQQPSLGGFFQPQSRSDDSGIIPASLGFAVDELIGTGPITAAIGLPADVGGVGFLQNGADARVGILEPEYRAGDELE